MRVLIVGRTYALKAHREKWKYLSPGIEAAFVTPRRIVHTLGVLEAEPSQEHRHFFVKAAGTNRLSGFWIDPIGFAKIVVSFGPNLLHVDEEPSSPATLLMALIARKAKLPMVFFSWENLPIKLNWLASVTYTLNLRLANGAIAGTAEAAQVLRSAGFSKPLAVIPQLGIEPTIFKPQPSKDGIHGLKNKVFTIGFVGRITPEKGVWVLMDALVALRHLSWQLLLVGEGPLRRSWLAEAQKKGIADRVIWVPPVPRQEVARYMNAMEVLVLPSLTTPRWKEQFGRVLVEAMACGVPVIGSNSGAIPEVVGEGGIIVPEGDAIALANAILRLMNNSEERYQIGSRGRNKVLASYTNQQICAATVRFWEEILRACELENKQQFGAD